MLFRGTFMRQRIKNILATALINRGKKRRVPVEELELRHQRQDIPGFNDSSYFAGLSPDGFSFVTRQSFRTGKPNENWLKVDVPGEGVWGFENREMEEGPGFKQEALEWKCLEPGNIWKIYYIGPLEQNGEEEEIEIDLTWKAASQIVDFDRMGTNPDHVALQVAKEKWSGRYFKRLGELRQVHYEQAGKITGTIKWKGKTHQVDLLGVRDHSYGARRWEDWDRHFWFLGMLDDGRFFNFSMVRYDFVKDLQAGFIVHEKKQISIDRLPYFEDLPWTEMLPEKLSLPVYEKKGQQGKTLQVNMKAFFPFVMDDVYHIRQAKAEFLYDGVRGLGIAEMGVNIKKYDIKIDHTG